MLIYTIEISGTPSSGTYSFNTLKIDNALLKQIIVKSTTTDTTYDIRLVNDKGHNLIDTSISGESPVYVFNKSYDIPVKGILTFSIFNASVDEAFTGSITLMEES